MRAFFYVLILLTICSCKIVHFGENSSTALHTEPQIGTVGLKNKNLLGSSFKEMGVPQLKEKIRLSAEQKLFTKTILSNYNKKVQDSSKKLEIIDSLNLRPNYFKIQISDKVGIIQELNSDENSRILEYLENTGENLMVTTLLIYFPDEIATSINNASEVYLVNNKKSAYSLELLNGDKTKAVIEFSKGVSFGYEFSAFCWSENTKHQPVIAAFRNKNGGCPGKTMKNPGKFDKKDLFEKM